MGRLFWKFFIVLWLVQLLSIVAVGSALWLHRVGQGDEPGAPPPAERFGPPTELPPRPGYPPPPRSRPLLPIAPLAGGVLGSLVSAALLAWFVARPIRNLRQAFAAASTGDLGVRIGEAAGHRNDELADLGRDFDRMAGQLQLLVDGQRRLLHDVSHELRSPLARLQAAIGLARQTPETMAASLERVEREAVRMDRLIGELLTLSRLEAGFTGRMDEDVDVGELLAGIVDDARFEAEAKGRGVVLEGVGEAHLRGNAELLHRAIENVVRNAIRYTFEGRRVGVTMATGGEPAVLRIAVCDEGPGVAEPDLGAIFVPFFRGQGGSGSDGHGLGLAIARRVVEAHGGHIGADNRPGGGLCVDIELPLAEAQRG